MARVISFFPKQTFSGQGNASGLTTIHSQVFDVGDFSRIVSEFRVFSLAAVSASYISGFIEESSTMDPNAWIQVTGFSIMTTGVAKFSFSDPLRFVRAKLEIPERVSTILFLEAQARESI